MLKFENYICRLLFVILGESEYMLIMAHNQIYIAVSPYWDTIENISYGGCNKLSKCDTDLNFAIGRNPDE